MTLTVVVLAPVVLAVLLWPGSGRATSGRDGSRRPESGWARSGWPRSGRARSGRARSGQAWSESASSGPSRSSTVDDVADAILLLGIALRGPAGVPSALERVAALSHGSVRRDLETVAAAHRWGIGGARAWEYVGPVWAPAARALHVADEAGAAPADLLMGAAARVRADEARRLEVAAARAGALLVLPLGLVVLPAFVCTAIVPVVLHLGRTLLH